MRKNFITIALSILLISLIIFTVQLYIGYTKLEAYANAQNALIDKYENVDNNGIKFIWNDDEESIPKDGSLIVIEKTDENLVYIGTLEANDVKVTIE
jgi:hypothetical protein